MGNPLKKEFKKAAKRLEKIQKKLAKFNKKPPLRYETEGKLARDLVKLYPLEKLRAMLLWYFESDEDFITKANYDIKTFKAILERTRKVGGSEE